MIVIKQIGVDVVVNLKSPAGKLLDEIDSPTGRNGDKIVEIIAEQSGTYGIGVKPINEREPAGKYQLEVHELRSADETRTLLRTRADARSAAAGFLRPGSKAIPESGIFPENITFANLDVMAAKSKVIGLGEATHGSREFNDARFSITRYLIRRHRFRVIAIEASASSMKKLTPYVSGETTQKLTVQEMWIGQRTRNELIEWLREWNRK